MKRNSLEARWGHWSLMVRSLIVFLALWAAPLSALAEVRLDGNWPDDEKVSLSARGVTRAEAVRSLAAEAGWSLVAQDLGDKKIDVEVKDQAAGAVLELLLSDGTFVAERRGQLVSIHAEVVAVPATTAPVASATPKSTPPLVKKGEDLIVTQTARVAPGDVVRDVIVWGDGDVVIEGTVTGNVAVFGGTAKIVGGANVGEGVFVFGGTAKIVGGAYVRGEVFALGGSVDLENGSQVDGEVNAFLGVLRRGDEVKVNCPSCGDEPENSWSPFFANFFERLTGASITWILGAVLVALGLRRVEVLRDEIVSRPMRCAGLGLVGFVAFALILLTLAVSLIGIPLAVLGGLFTGFSIYLGYAVVLLSFGGVLLGERSKNPYVHLALGCSIVFVTQWIPVVDAVVCLLAIAIAFGALIATRGAGWLKRKTPAPDVASGGALP